MSLIRAAIEGAVEQAMLEHPKYFTPQGAKSARTLIVRKVMAALRDGGEKPSESQDADTSAEPKILFAAAGSREARGYINLRQIAGATAPNRTSDGSVVVMAAANCEAVFAFADLPSDENWLFVSERKQLGAWGEFFREKLPNVARRQIALQREGQTGMLLPWPFPPSATGKIYEATEAA